MANVCGVSLHVCRIRATRLDSDGNVAASPNNSAVDDKPVQVTMTPRISAGADLELKGGCDCIIASYLGPDIVKGWDLAVDKGAINFALEEILLGGSAITAGADLIGRWFAGPLDCGETQPKSAFEFWTDVWDGNAQSTVWPRLHYVFPGTTWAEGTTTAQNNLVPEPITGKAVANDNWANGPYGDQPEAVPAGMPGGRWLTTDAFPTATCGYSDVTPAS